MLVVTVPKGAMDAPFKVAVKGMGEKESENVFQVVRPQAPAAPAAPAPAAAAAPAPAQPPAAQPPAAKPTQPPAAQPPAAQPPAVKPAQPPAAQPPASKPTQPPPSLDDLMGIDSKNQPTIASFDPPKAPVGETITI